MHTVVLVNPFRCRMWKLHDRIDTQVTEETCRAEIESFGRHGQLVPALGRKLREDLTHDVELIYGARRLFVAQHLNRPLKVEIRSLSDRDAIVAMDIENRQRQDISPYERGTSYARWLRTGHFQSQEEIAHALKVSASQVSRLLQLARLPAVIVDAFNSPSEICEGWGLALFEAFQDPSRKQRTVDAARAVAKMVPRPIGRDVYRQLLMASAHGRRVRPKVRDEVVKDQRGDPLFRVRYQTDSIAVVLRMEKISADLLERIRSSISKILQDERKQAAESPNKVLERQRKAEIDAGGGTRKLALDRATSAHDATAGRGGSPILGRSQSVRSRAENP